MMMDSAADLANGEDGSPSPALHHNHAAHIAGNINQDTKQSVKYVS